jgi:hypothetical protein
LVDEPALPWATEDDGGCLSANALIQAGIAMAKNPGLQRCGRTQFPCWLHHMRRTTTIRAIPGVVRYRSHQGYNAVLSEKTKGAKADICARASAIQGILIRVLG